MIGNKWISIILSLCIILCSQSCKKGCSDPRAFNYQKNAKENDGSCLYCDSSMQNYGYSYTYITDYNSSSPYYNQQVMNVQVNQSLIYYTGNGCKLLGKVNYNPISGCNNYTYSATIYNEINSTVTYSGDIQVLPYTGSYITYHVSSLTIAPYGTSTINLGSSCSQSSGFNIQGINTTFQYH